MSTDLWDRLPDPSEYARRLEDEAEWRDAMEVARIERLYDKGGVFRCETCECGGLPDCPHCYSAEIRDPKHPRHHEVMSDISDMREGK